MRRSRSFGLCWIAITALFAWAGSAAGVIPAKAGIQFGESPRTLDSRFRGNDGEGVGVSPVVEASRPQSSAASYPDRATLPQGASGNWWAATQKAIAGSEYRVTWQEQTVLPDHPPAYQAPNRAQGLRTYFTPQGPRMMRRTEAEPTWVWGLEFAGLRIADCGLRNEEVAGPCMQPDVDAIAVNGNRVEYRRGDGLTEWYMNDPKGLEQGFTISALPQSSIVNRQSSITVDLAVRGDLTPNMMADGTTVEFLSRAGVGLIHYGQARAYDATGTPLDVSLRILNGVSPSRGQACPESDDFILHPSSFILRLTVDAADAVFPVTIDPLATSAAWTAESNQVDAYFGCSVATAGDVNGDGFSDVIVGASGYDNGQIDEGKVFVYYGSASGLSAAADWTAEGNQADASFGASVATAGDVNGDGFSDVIIGAPGYANGQTDEGAVFVYYGSGSGLSGTPDWTKESDQSGAMFGTSVATAGDVNGDGYSDVIIGAPRFGNGEGGEGRAFVYHGSGSGLSATPNWTAESNQPNAYFGTSVSTAGDVNGDGYADVIVGAPAYDDAGLTDQGRAYVYQGSASGLNASAAWTAQNGQMSAEFGFAVSTAGDINGDGYADVIVGAHLWDENALSDQGKAFLYLGSASGLAASVSWTALSNQALAEFGGAVATAGDVNGDGYADVIVGALKFDNGESDEGRAYVYYGSPSMLSLTANWSAESDQAGAELGWSVSTAGDVNGDGYADVIVGAPYFDNGQLDEGRVFVYHGSISGVNAVANWTVESDQGGALFGWSVSTAGDVNGDGYCDVIVGAPYFDNGQVDEGRAFVYHGSASGLSATPGWTAESNQANAAFGYSVSAGDVNGDGYADAIIGTPYYAGGEPDEGRADVYYGSTTGLSLTPDWTAESNQIGAHFGIAAASAGDVNGDGYADVIVGARDYTNGQTGEGRAFVFHGSGAGPSATPDWGAESDQIGAHLGASVSSAGDVNGDGYADVIVGAYLCDGAQIDEGRAYAYHGSASGLSATPNWTAQGVQGGARLGWSVSTAGDVNGDGYADVIVGAPYYDNAEADEGRAYVYKGSASGLSATANWTVESDQTDARMGTSVSTAGDVNGDGYADVIVGASKFDNPEMEEGRVSVYYGNGEAGRGMSVWPRQRRADDSAPIAPTGSSDSATSARLAALGRTPFGRGKLKLECEVKPLGAAFNGTGTVLTAGWTDTGVSGAPLAHTVDGLSSPAVYHWRVRLRYSSATTPYQQSSRWFTMPWNGWQESDFRTPGPPVAPTQPGATAISTSAITWTWKDNSSSETGFKVWDDPGAGPPVTLQTTTGVNASQWPHTGLSPNAQYAFQTAATNPYGDSALTPNYTAWTLIEAVSALAFSNVGTDTISVASINTPSNLASGTSGLYFANTITATNSGWQQDNAPWTSSGLTPNTAYAFIGKSRNGVSVETAEAADTKYTLAATPVAPVVSDPAVHALDVAVGSGDGNPAATVYAIRIAPDVGGNVWVQGDGSVGAAPDYRTAADWGTTTVSGLAEYTSYAFEATARNGDGVVTAPGPANSARTRDGTPPTGTVTINGGAAYTNSVSVSLTLTWDDGAGSGVTDMRFSNDGNAWSTWESYATPKAWTLLSGDGGKTVYAQYRDAEMNVSTGTIRDDITLDTVAPWVVSITREQATPTNLSTVQFTVLFSESVTDLEPNDFFVTAPGIIGAVVSGITGGGSFYHVSVDTGTGDGTLRLDVVDDDTVVDLAGNPLGGFGIGNGNYTGGQSYTIDKTPPAVLSSTRLDASPTNASTVRFSVVFSESVANVNTTDFHVTLVGVVGASVTNVAGTGSTYTVTVQTGSGDGTIRLDVTDDDSIRDAATNRLGGSGTGNGNYSSGQTYAIDKSIPFVQNILLDSANPTNQAQVVFRVNFNENVTGVDASDLALSVTGVIGASVVSVTPTTPQTYVVTVNTGANSGTIRLDVIDDDSIRDSVLAPLGGPGAGNGDYTTGPYFQIDKDPPTGTPTLDHSTFTAADAVQFSVDFSESVGTSFTAADVTLTGTLNGVVEVAGADATYTVTVTLADPDADGAIGILVGTNVWDLVGNPYAGGVSPQYIVHNWPGFRAEPQDVQTYTGEPVTFSVSVNEGGVPTTYAWKWDDGQGINDGPTTPTWDLPGVAPGSEGTYWCEVDYDGERHISRAASLSVEDHLTIAVQPAGADAEWGSVYLFSVSVTGGYPPLYYQWRQDGNDLPDGTDAEYMIPFVQGAYLGAYTVQISDSFTDVEVSEPAVLTSSTHLPVSGVVGVGMLLLVLTAAGVLAHRRIGRRT